mgnify:CR=1 FL=1
MVWTLSKRTTSVSSPQSINICINCNCANKETISALNYIFMALLLWSHACFSTSTMSTTKKNERITRNRLWKSICICESCLFRKMSHQPFAKSKAVIEFPLQLVHKDMCGPFSVPSLSRARYFISFIDNTTRFTVVNFLKHKSEAFAAFCKYK